MDEKFKVVDDKTADWAIRKIKEEAEEQDRLISLAESQIDDLENQINKIHTQYAYNTSYLKSLLAEYFATVKHKETKTQESYKLLSGSLVLKKPTTKIIKDDEKLVEYFKKNNLEKYIKVSESPKWADFKSQVKVVGKDVIDNETGEIIDGLKTEEIPATFNVKF